MSPAVRRGVRVSERVEASGIWWAAKTSTMEHAAECFHGRITLKLYQSEDKKYDLREVNMASSMFSFPSLSRSNSRSCMIASETSKFGSTLANSNLSSNPSRSES